MANYTVQKNDNLYKIVREKYGLRKNSDIINTIKLIKENNNLKNVNIINVGQELVLPEQLKLNNVTVFGENNKSVLTSEQNNYYRANDVFGDTATKKDEYKDQEFVE